MTDQRPVVIYGAGGYTGRLIAEYLREYNVPFVAAGRSCDAVPESMSRVPGIETADYEVAEVDGSVDALAELFSGARVVCNTVGPHKRLGPTVAEACLQAGCHYLDTTGEQTWMLEAKTAFGTRFAGNGLLASPGIAQMYTTGEIAANICLETPGLDTLDMLVLWRGAPSYASMQTVFVTLTADCYYLEQNEYVEWPPGRSYDVVVPGQHELGLALPWGGTSNPVWFKDDPRVANCKAYGGLFNRALMENVVQMAATIERDIKPLPVDQQRAALAKHAAGVQAGTPPREQQRVNRSIDSVHASGPLGRRVHCMLEGTCNYKQTALLQAYAAHCLIQAPPPRVGFASACQVFGHRELLGALQSFGLVGEPKVTRD